MSDLLDALEVDLPPDLLTLALTHRSYAYEHGGLPTNERLEFLGDAVLGLTVTDELFHRHPQRPESDLAKMRAGVVKTQAVAEVQRLLADQEREFTAAVVVMDNRYGSGIGRTKKEAEQKAAEKACQALNRLNSVAPGETAG